jgi:hypothetical protein
VGTPIRVVFGGVVLLVLVLVFVAGLSTERRERETDSGPLQGGRPWDSGSFESAAINEGAAISIGVYVPVPAELEADLVLDGVTLAGRADELDVVGVRVSTGAGPSFVCAGAIRGFPPAGCRLFPLPGWHVSPEAIVHRGFQVILGLSTSHAGVFGFPAVVLRYHDAHASYEAVFLQGAQLCVPRAHYKSGCHATAELGSLQSRLARQLEDRAR